MKRIIKEFVDNIYKSKLYIPDPLYSLKLLKKAGFEPKTVYDVGAYNGDFATMVLNIWPKCKVNCFEALSEKVSLLQAKFRNENVEIFEGLVGEKIDDLVEFHEVESASSVLEEQLSNEFPTTIKKMRTLDHYIMDLNLDIPQLLKIDTQGYEYYVLKGINNNIRSVDVVLAELNFIDIHKNVKLAHEVINFLADNGFVIFDICQLHRRPSDRALWQADFIFVKEDFILRQNKKW